MPSAIKVWNLSTVTADDFVPGTALATEASLLKAFQNSDGGLFINGVGGVLKITMGTNSYFLADSNGNGLFDSAVGDLTPDLFVKIVGTVSTDNFTGLALTV